LAGEAVRKFVAEGVGGLARQRIFTASAVKKIFAGPWTDRLDLFILDQLPLFSP
jgi:hypothetical protein